MQNGSPDRRSLPNAVEFNSLRPHNQSYSSTTTECFTAKVANFSTDLLLSQMA
jgi:hypothetical protein